MKRITLILVLTVIVLANAAAQQGAKQASVADITFTYTKQGGMGSNQFAIWIEDADGQYVKTLYATRFTANGGWKRRPASIPLWVKQSGIAKKSAKEIDAIGGATPKAGALAYSWDGKNEKGKAVPDGEYFLILEASLRNDNYALYRVPVIIGQGASSHDAVPEYSGSSTAEHGMISDVKVKVIR